VVVAAVTRLSLLSEPCQLVPDRAGPVGAPQRQKPVLLDDIIKTSAAAAAIADSNSLLHPRLWILTARAAICVCHRSPMRALWHTFTTFSLDTTQFQGPGQGLL